MIKEYLISHARGDATYFMHKRSKANRIYHKINTGFVQELWHLNSQARKEDKRDLNLIRFK